MSSLAMGQTLRKGCLLLLFLVVLCCVIYPLALWGIGKIFFPFQANGSLVLSADGKPVGSRLIAQAFDRDEYFHPRPSAAGYNAAASASSSLAASNYALRERVTKAISLIYQNQQETNLESIPSDMLMTSASGLDPHITLQNAKYQLDRIVTRWAAELKRNPNDVRQEIENIIQKNTRAPWGGLAGEKFVNVLEVNLEIYKRYGDPPVMR